MPGYHVVRSIEIDANADRVRAATQDFAEWPKWSPWLCMEPDTKLNVFGAPGEAGHNYDWDGEIVGAGSMNIEAISRDRQDMTLKFLRPFKSEARVTLEVESPSDAETRVTWHMRGKLPFFLFFMLGTMKAMIGMDFERGLKMLKEYVETGTVESHSELLGIVDVPRTHYVGVEARCSMSEIGDSMRQTLPAVHKIATENGVEMSGPPGTIYHEYDMKAQTCHYTSFVPTPSSAEVSGATSGTIDACKALKVVHTGNYEHLANAWSTGMAYQRYKKLKPLKGQPPFEIYSSDPEQTPVEDIVTEIYFPLRA